MNLQASQEGYLCRYCNKPRNGFVCICEDGKEIVWDRGQRIRNRLEKLKQKKK